MLEPYKSEVDALRRAFSGFPSGVAVVAAVVAGDPSVLIASSFTVGVSQDPPMVMFAVQKTSTTWPALSQASVLGVSVLGDTHAAHVRQLASKSKEQRFAGVSTTVGENGAVFLDSAPIWLECTVEHCYPAGDHDIIVLRVLGFVSDFAHSPLVWHRSQFASLPTAS